jgi:hypothetical protein
LLLTVVVAGAGGLLCGIQAAVQPAASEGGQTRTRAAGGRDDRASVPGQEKPDAIAWGEAVDGLKAGIGFRPGDKHSYQEGQSVTLVVYLRNVSGRRTTVSIIETLFEEWLPLVEDQRGTKQTVVAGPRNLGEVSIVKRTLEAGETIRLGTAWLLIEKPGWKGPAAGPTLLAPPGTYRIRCRDFPLRRDNNRLDEHRWATGPVELRITGAAETAPESVGSLGIQISHGPDGKTVVITEVDAGGPAAAAGLRPGDVITHVGDTEVTDIISAARLIARMKQGEVADVRVERRVKVTVGRRSR